MSGNRSKSAFVFRKGWVTLSADFRGKEVSFRLLCRDLSDPSSLTELWLPSHCQKLR